MRSGGIGKLALFGGRSTTVTPVDQQRRPKGTPVSPQRFSHWPGCPRPVRRFDRQLRSGRARTAATASWGAKRGHVPDTTSATRRPEALERVVIRFAGDSDDGMQLVGDRFTDMSAAFGNDLATLPNYPAEIRAPAGTIAGVSSFQVHIADFDIVTPGDVPNLLGAMNPAALKANIADLAPGASIIVNTDAFEPRNLEKAGYAGNPLEDDSLAAFTVYPVPMTSITVEAAKDTGAKPRDAERSKNFFALGLI
jgi:Pyruvate/2-oxoacid:ferredoxin oxidoreductase gamma subunit